MKTKTKEFSISSDFMRLEHTETIEVVETFEASKTL